MEDIMYFPGWQKSEFVCHRGNDLDDFKWSFSSGGKFLRGVAEFQISPF